MNGIENIVEKILTDAHNEKNGIITKAQKEADTIKSDYDARVEKETARLAEKNTLKADQLKQRIMVNGEVRIRKKLLAAKQDLINQAFVKAVEEVNSCSAEEKQKLLVSLVMQSVETGDEQLIFSSGLQAQYGEAVINAVNSERANSDEHAQLTVSEETREIGFGVIIKGEGIEVNCTVETLIWQLRDALVIQLTEVLFQDEDSA